MISIHYFIHIIIFIQGGWTKGRLNCPNCQSRIGGFDFVSGADYPVHLIKSKVDYWKKSSNNSTEDNSSIGRLIASQ